MCCSGKCYHVRTTNAAPHLLTSLRGCRYAGVLLKYATPSLWAAIVLAMESAKDVEYDHLIFGVCWLIIIWCVVMAVAQLGLHFLHHLLTYTDSKAKRRGQRRALVILAALHHKILRSKRKRGLATSDVYVSVKAPHAAIAEEATSPPAGHRPSGHNGTTTKRRPRALSGGDSAAAATAAAPAPSTNGTASHLVHSEAKANADAHTPHRSGAQALAASHGDARAGLDKHITVSMNPLVPDHVKDDVAKGIIPGGGSAIAIHDDMDLPGRHRGGSGSEHAPKTSASAVTRMATTPSHHMSFNFNLMHRPKVSHIKSVQETKGELASFLGLLEEQDVRNATLAELFMYLRSVNAGQSMLVNSDTLLKVLSYHDAQVMAEHLAMFRTAFTRDEFCAAVAHLFEQFTSNSRLRSGQFKYTWILSKLVRVWWQVAAARF